MEEIILKAEPRTQFGTRASRRIREQGLLPAVLCGQGQESLSLSLDSKAFTKFLEAGHRFATIEIEDSKERGLVKEVQYDVYGTHIVHVDFARVRRDQKVEVSVPVEPMGTPKGVTAGGVLSFPMQEITVSGLPEHIPEKVRVHIEALELGQFLRVKDVEPPANCVFVGDPERVIVAVMHKREEITAAPAEVQPAQPEVIGKKKEEAEAPPEAEEKKKS